MCSGLTLTNFESLGEERNDWSKESNVFAERKMIRHVLPSRRHHHLPVPVRSLKSLRLSSLLSLPYIPYTIPLNISLTLTPTLTSPFCSTSLTSPGTWRTKQPPTGTQMPLTS